jgi:Probable zinc-ribbon domain
MNDDITGDITTICTDCGQPFIFNTGEQAYFAERGFRPPKRCKPCRDYRKSEAVRVSREQIG